jgi:hypothetical protein
LPSPGTGTFLRFSVWCPVRRCLLSARTRLSGFCGGNSIYFSSQNRDLTRPKTLPRSQLFEHITTALKHAPLYQPTAHKLSITYTRSWSLYNASEHRIPQGRHVIATTCAAARKSKRLSGRLETIARQHTHIHTSDHGYQREPIRPGRRGRNGRH